ncbi:uncharacterized protein LOC135840952 [Planococcus citri]|uniref:uncharacterized protein LOC135840952 n=1 Tax=Planococcus citri TaxID=170843 RepID=UPI0031FA1E38
MIIMSELHRKIIRNKLQKMEFDVDRFATVVEDFVKDYASHPISEAVRTSIESYMKILRKTSDGDESSISNNNTNYSDNDCEPVVAEEQDAVLVQERFAKQLASDIRELFPSNKMQKVAALTLCYQLGIPNTTRILFGLCTPLPYKRCRIKKRSIFKVTTVK